MKRLKGRLVESRYRIITSLERAGYDQEIAGRFAKDQRLLAEVCKKRWNLPDSVVKMNPLWVDWAAIADYADPSRSLRNQFRGKKPKKVKPKGFYDSPEWLQVRYMALKKYGRQCAVCGATPGGAVKMHVDHIKPRSRFPHLELSLDNLQVLCAACNVGKGNRDEIDWRKP